METLVIKTARATIPYAQPEMKFRSPPGLFHHEPPLLNMQRYVTSVAGQTCSFNGKAAMRGSQYLCLNKNV